jgi:hypothetical protein
MAGWQKGSVLDNFHQAALVLGFDNLPIAWGLAKVNFPSVEERDKVLRALTGLNEGKQQSATPTA